MNIKHNVLVQIVTEKFFRPDWVSDSRPSGSESGALPTELCGRTQRIIMKCFIYMSVTEEVLGSDPNDTVPQIRLSNAV